MNRLINWIKKIIKNGSKYDKNIFSIDEDFEKFSLILIEINNQMELSFYDFFNFNLRKSIIKSLYLNITSLITDKHTSNNSNSKGRYEFFCIERFLNDLGAINPSLKKDLRKRLEKIHKNKTMKKIQRSRNTEIAHFSLEKYRTKNNDFLLKNFNYKETEILVKEINYLFNYICFNLKGSEFAFELIKELNKDQIENINKAVKGGEKWTKYEREYRFRRRIVNNDLLSDNICFDEKYGDFENFIEQNIKLL